MIKRFLKVTLLAVAAASLNAGFATAQDGAVSDAQAAAQANNPLADIRAFNFQNYYIGDVHRSS